MARSLIGLDVGTAAVRAAEVRIGRGKASLVRFGQVALAPGAVVAGEVVDATAVGAALKRLWRDGGFKSKRVVTGIAGQRVVARTTELPALSDDDLRSSLPFQVQELIPIPVEDAVIDFQTLETVPGEDGTDRLRVLVVAAHRDVVRSLLAALDDAGLTADRVDLIPSALIRALHERDFAELVEDDRAATAEAIVDIGGGVSNVVVHEHGVPRFLRSLATGGVEITEALVTDLDVDFEEAEALKRRASVDVDADVDAATEVAVEHARDVVRAALSPMLEEVRTSLDFWQAQAGNEELRRVVLTGGGARAAEVEDRLARLLGVPVVRGRPFQHVEMKAGLDDDTVLAAQSVAAVAVGLALSGESLPAGGRRISLLPGEIEVSRRERRQVAFAAAGVAAFAGLLLGVYALRNGQVSQAEDDAAAAEARTAELNAQISQLQDVEGLELDIAQRRERVLAVLDGDIAWTRLIQEVAAVLPEDVWLTTLQATRLGGTGFGSVNFGGMGFDQTSTAHWIIRLSELESLTSLWVPSSAKGAAGGGAEIVTFTSNAELTAEAQSDRAERYGGGTP